jgi:hypothetical protein
VVVVSEEPNIATFHLAPTFDHASSLGRNETDLARRRRLDTKDQRDTVEAYAARCRSAFFGHVNALKTLTQQELVSELRKAYPEATLFWAKILCGLQRTFFEGVFARISPQLISEEAAAFALGILQANQSSLREHALDQ